MPVYRQIKEPFITVGSSKADFITTGTADNVVIQAAINSLSSSGGTVFIKAGSYTLAATITIASDNITVEGAGRSTILNFPGATVSPAFAMADTTQRTVILRDIRFNNTSAAGNGVAVEGSYFVYSDFSNITITGGVLGGFNFNVIGTYYNLVEHCYIVPNGVGSYGINFDNTANENTVLRTRIVPDTNAVGVMVNAHSNGLYEVEVETGCLIGIQVKSLGHGTLISGCYLEANQTNLQLESGVRSVLITTGEIADATTANFTDNGAISYQFIQTHMQYVNLNKIGGSTVEGQQVINLGPTPIEALLLDMAQPTSGAASQRISHSLVWRGTTWDGSAGHNIDYKSFVTPTASGSLWSLQARTDSNSYVTKYSVDGSGLFTLSNRLILGGAITRKVSTKTNTYSVANTDDFIRADGTSTAFIVTLPTAVGFTGVTFTIEKVDSSGNAITVATTSAQTINGATTQTLSTQFQSITVVSNGSNWEGVPTLATSSTGITRFVSSVSAATSAGATASTDYVYLVSGTTTLTLPTAIGNTNLYTVKNTGSNTVTVATTSAQTIDGSSTASLPVANTSLSFVSDNANWRIV